MAKIRKDKPPLAVVDVSDSPELAALAERVARTRTAISLRCGDKELAQIVPAAGTPSAPKFDPERFQANLAALQEMWANSGLDADEVIADIYRAREEGSRPWDRP
jgi:hypothetical protein